MPMTMNNLQNIDLDQLSPSQLKKIQALLTPKLTKYIPYEPTAKQRAFLLMNDCLDVLYGGA